MAKTSTSFKPGEVNNPNGRPKREWTVAGLIQDAMERQDETGVPYKKIVYDKLVDLAKSGDVVAIKEINNRLDGMPKQAIEQKVEVTHVVPILGGVSNVPINDSNPKTS